LIEQAIQALEAIQKEAAKEEAVQEVTPEILKHFKGRASYDRKTKVLTLTYDFQNAIQLDDFDAENAKPVVRRGTLFIPVAEQIKHKVRFDTLTLTTQLAIGNIAGRHIQTAGGYGVSTHTYNGFHVNLLNDSGGGATGRYTNPYGGERVGTNLFHPV